MKLPFKMLLAAATILLAWSAPTVNAAPVGYYTDQKVVYHNDGGTPDNAAYFKRMLNSINNQIEAVGRDHVQIRVVDHGAGVDMFRIAQSDKDLAEQIDLLREKGVRFLICANTLKERKLKWHQLYGVKQEDIVPSGVAELARLQQMGFVYIHL